MHALIYVCIHTYICTHVYVCVCAYMHVGNWECVYSSSVFQNETVYKDGKMETFLKSTLIHSVVAALNPAVKYKQSGEN